MTEEKRNKFKKELDELQKKHKLSIEPEIYISTKGVYPIIKLVDQEEEKKEVKQK